MHKETSQASGISLSSSLSFMQEGLAGAWRRLVLPVHPGLETAWSHCSRDSTHVPRHSVSWSLGSRDDYCLCLQWFNCGAFTQNYRIYLFTDKKNNFFSLCISKNLNFCQMNWHHFNSFFSFHLSLTQKVLNPLFIFLMFSFKQFHGECRRVFPVNQCTILLLHRTPQVDGNKTQLALVNAMTDAKL